MDRDEITRIEKQDRVKQRLGKDAVLVIEGLEVAVGRMMKSNLPSHSKVIWLRRFARVFSETVAPATACRGKGCSHCCHMAVCITTAEAAEIGRTIGAKPRTLPIELDPIKVINQLDANVEKFTGKPCPFLQEDKSCGIYNVRPIACIVHHSTESTPDPCVIGSGQMVGRVDDRSISVAMAEVDFPRPIADIRDFFPDGNYFLI